MQNILVGFIMDQPLSLFYCLLACLALHAFVLFSLHNTVELPSLSISHPACASQPIIRHAR
jgi:hypothetical protein